MKYLQYDYSFMMSSALPVKGIHSDVLSQFIPRARDFRTTTILNNESPLGFMQLPFDADTLALIENKALQAKKAFSHLLVLGIGGSDLGARAVISALHPTSGMTVSFLGGNSDPQEIAEVLSQLDLKSTLVNVISKSGDTIETMSTFLHVRQLLIEIVGLDHHSEHIIATTDKSKGTLHALCIEYGYDFLVVPDSVGGRFSVLSTVGLFPIACSGIDIRKLVNGAQEVCQDLQNSSTESLHAVEIYSVLHFVGYVQHGYDIHVFIPYIQRLREFGFWYRQLWAESLGKKDSLSGEEVFVGPTPVAALGSTDQHSQFQLYYFGPYNKIITFVDVEDYESPLAVPDVSTSIEGISYMSKLPFQKIIRAELQASSLALAERERLNGRLVIPSLTPESLGSLIQFFEIATAYMGHFLNINTYDQPGVELGKQNMYALFGREGYEKRYTELQTLLSKYNKFVA